MPNTIRPRWHTAESTVYSVLKENARVNRAQLTEAENLLWHYAKGSGLGEKCRRQYIIGEYIVDFFFRNSRLIVELDGGYHFTEEQQQADKKRQQWLEAKGYTVLRFTNEEVIANTDEVIKRIRNRMTVEETL